MIKNPFKGLMPAMMTPLKDNEDVDLAAIERLAPYLTRGSIDKLFVLGYCGECFSFNREERKQIIAQTRQVLSQDKIVVAGIMGNSTREIIQYAEDAAEAGADYVLTTPTNFLVVGDDELIRLFTEIADHSPRPLVIYNCPENVQTLNVNVISALAKHKNIVGMKQTSDHIGLLEMKLATMNDDFTIISGHEYTFLAALAAGIDSFIMGGPGNVCPQTCLKILQEFEKGNVETARKQFLHMTSFLMELYSLPGMAEATCKAVLEMKGLCGRKMRSPASTCPEEQFARIQALADKYEMDLD